MNAIHGVQSSCVKAKDGTVYCPTSFPNPVNFGTTFNDTLALEMGAIIATETRALWLAGATEESVWSGRPVIGLDVWSPNINLARKWPAFAGIVARAGPAHSRQPPSPADPRARRSALGTHGRNRR